VLGQRSRIILEEQEMFDEGEADSISMLAAIAFAAVALAVFGCAEVPVGPSVAVMPASNKTFELFVQDDQLCRGWAAHSIGIPGHNAAVERVLATTITGAILGAIVGGSRNFDSGAATGAVLGSAVGAQQSAVIAANAQRRYDIAYQQCMFSRGHFVAGYGYPQNGLAPPTLLVPGAPSR
jgi:hypothetical protein